MKKKQNKWEFQELEIPQSTKNSIPKAQNRKILKSAFARQSECTSGNSKQNIKKRKSNMYNTKSERRISHVLNTCSALAKFSFTITLNCFALQSSGCKAVPGYNKLNN